MTGEYVEDKNDDGRRLRIRMTSKMWREGHLFKDSVVETDKLPHQKESSLAPPCHVHYHFHYHYNCHYLYQFHYHYHCHCLVSLFAQK